MIAEHLGSEQVSRVIYGAIIGLALIVALENHPPRSAVVAATLVATGLAVGLAEVYADVIGAELRLRRRLGRQQWRHILVDLGAVFFGIVFPSVFFVLAALAVMKDETAFTVAKWSGLGLIAFYGFSAGRLAGASTGRSLVQALAVAAIGGALIAFKALLH